MVDGGYYVDGKTFVDVNETEIKEVAMKIKSSTVKNVVISGWIHSGLFLGMLAHALISGIYSPLIPDQEQRVADILRENIPGISITLSHEIGHMGLLERENAAILNECLKPLCAVTLSGFQAAVSSLGFGECPLFLTQNDGTLARY